MSWTKDVQAAYGVGTCRGCTNRYTLTKRGLIRSHGPYGGRRCIGSGEEPREHLRMGRDYTPADVYRATGDPVPPVWAEHEKQLKAASA